MTPTGRSQAPLSEKTLAEIEAKHMDKDSPILVRLFKEEAEMEVWKKNRDGEFALLKTYPICRWSGDLGPKIKEGDRQAPEGFYTITPGQMNPNSNYYLAFNTGYPNAFDRAWNRTGSELMVHGDCSSRGCYAMTDEQMQEIYALARESFFGGQKDFQFEAFPFRMTALNMAKHRNNPNFAFWKMIKEGYDHFEATHQEPKVAVCEKRYVFDAAQPADASQAAQVRCARQMPGVPARPDHRRRGARSSPARASRDGQLYRPRRRRGAVACRHRRRHEPGVRGQARAPIPNSTITAALIWSPATVRRPARCRARQSRRTTTAEARQDAPAAGEPSRW